MDKELRGKEGFIAAFAKAQGSVSAVKTDSKNPHFGNNYASLTAVVAALKPFFDAGFSIVQGGVDIGGKAYLRTRVFHSPSGWEELTDYPLIVNDANPQHLASATTYARRYALVAFFGLCVEDDDGNAAAKPPASKVAKPTEAAQKVFGKSADAHTTAPATPYGEVLTARFIPKVYTAKENKAGKMNYSVLDPETDQWYSTQNDAHAAVLSQAKGESKKIVLAYKMNGTFRNIQKVYFDEVPSEPEQEQVPF